jgi:hypothetical protein
MGLFDFSKNKPEPIKKNAKYKAVEKKSDNVQYLNEIQKEVHKYLKPLGFKKKGRTFNRQTEDGLWQVVNFQSGQFPVGDNYEIPGFRESFYGKFTVNLGIIVEELYLIKKIGKPKTFYQDYDCQIRTRLSQLIFSNDYWWNITEEITKISEQIIQGFNNEGISWLDTFETRKKICSNLDNIRGFTSIANLDIAIIIYQKDKKKGAKLFQKYYDSINSHKGHKEYVKELSVELGIKLTENNNE